MREETMMNGSGRSVMMAAVVGAAVGAGVALLFAPCSGKETRGWLSKQRRGMSKKADHAIEAGKQVVRSAADQVGELADMVTGSGSDGSSMTSKGGVRRIHS